MKNYVMPGHTLTVTAPYALASGDGCLVGSIFGVACGAYANGFVDTELRVEGIYELTALGTDTATVGALAYWDNTNRRITTTASGNTKVGVFAVAKTSGPTIAVVRLSAAF
jgi:predicted RecA/RadA family phage recombinase